MHRERDHFPDQPIGDLKIAFVEPVVVVRFLLMERNRIVDSAGNSIFVEVRHKLISSAVGDP